MVERYNAILTRLKEGPISEVVVRASDYDADLAAARAEIERLTKERDLSKELLRSCIQGNNVIRKKAQKAIAERDEARSTLADAERDMRQRAADLCDCACMDGIGDKIRAIGDEILALPLKHADREGGV